MRSGRTHTAGRALCAFAIGLGSLHSLAASDLGRDEEVVVLRGDLDPSLLAMPPERLAFRWSPGWTRVSMQVDEQAVVDFATIYGEAEPSGFTVLTYTDSGTFTGPDPDPLLDADDEIVVRARDAGVRASEGAGEPGGVVPGSGLELALANPVTGGTAWIYLFRSDGSLPPLPPSPDVDLRLLSPLRRLPGDLRHNRSEPGQPRDVGRLEALLPRRLLRSMAPRGDGDRARRRTGDRSTGSASQPVRSRQLHELISGRGDAVNTHDILTGSDPAGNYSTAGGDTTCGNWTKSGDGSAIVGHHDRVGLKDTRHMKSWNSSHGTVGCSQEALAKTGGSGLFYCFVAD